MDDHTLSAGQFKATCLKLMDEVAASGREVTITKRGKPVARLVPIAKSVSERPVLFGALAHCTRITGDILRPLANGPGPSAKWARIEKEVSSASRRAKPR